METTASPTENIIMSPLQSRQSSSSASEQEANPSSPDTTITEPEHPPRLNPLEDEDEDEDEDDVWDTSSDHHSLTNHNTSINDEDSNPMFHHDSTILSDLPALRRQHMTDGYREGLSVGKARVMQSGFDAGYPLGVEVGLRVGNVLGVLEGVVAALTGKSRGGQSQAKGRGGSKGGLVESSAAGDDVVESHGSAATDTVFQNEQHLKFVHTLYARAQSELKISELLSVVNDATIAKIPATTSGSSDTPKDPAEQELEEHNEYGKSTQEITTMVPSEIEDVLVRWERLVLGSLPS